MRKALTVRGLGIFLRTFFVPCVLGAALQKAGGEEFKEEVKKLASSHGNLETASGQCIGV